LFLRFQFINLRLNLCSLKSAKILKYSGPGIYKQFLFSSTNSIFMFYLRHSSGLQGYFTNTNSSALSREIYFYCSILRVRRYCAVLLIFTKLKPALLR